MNADVKAKWVAALRSGEYEQTRLRLRADDGFCCLGILCELAVVDGVIPPAILPTNYVCWAYGDDCTSNLPPAVQDWAGLTAPLGDAVKIDGHLDALAVHNDAHVTFAVLADAIETQL